MLYRKAGIDAQPKAVARFSPDHPVSERLLLAMAGEITHHGLVHFFRHQFKEVIKIFGKYRPGNRFIWR